MEKYFEEIQSRVDNAYAIAIKARAKKYDPEIKKISAKKILGQKYPLNPSMNINVLKKIIK